MGGRTLEWTVVLATFNGDGQCLADDIVTFRFAPGELSVGLNDELDRFLQAIARFLERALLHVAARQLLDVPDPPVAHLFEHSGVAILHSCILARQLAANQCWATPHIS